jgi:hypothetical protein
MIYDPFREKGILSLLQSTEEEGRIFNLFPVYGKREE